MQVRLAVYRDATCCLLCVYKRTLAWTERMSVSSRDPVIARIVTYVRC